MKILFVTSEAAPMVKVGGLADVAGSLPRALRKAGHDIRILMPAYEAIDRTRFPIDGEEFAVPVPVPGGTVDVRILRGRLPNSDVPVWYLDWPGIFSGEIYNSLPDSVSLEKELRRFTFFSWAAAHVVRVLTWRPDIVHCQDWHTGFVPSLLRVTVPRERPATVLTIHNLHSQGVWRASEVFSWIGISGAEDPVLAIRDQHRDLNLLQQGIHAADIVSTVSPTYAQEILTPEYGEGLESDLRGQGVVGILNGIDTDQFNPETDNVIPARFTASTAAEGKASNKAALQSAVGLPRRPDAPLFGFIGRFSPQKGADLVTAVVPQIAAAGGQVVILGSGQPEIEAATAEETRHYPESVHVHIGFNAGLAQQIYAGADFLLMPSRFEPCGLGQMIAMRYGTIPIVRDTGGLHDTVIDADADQKRGCGYVFRGADAPSLWQAVERAVARWRDTNLHQSLVRRSMSVDVSWYTSARHYSDLYAKAQKHITTAT